MKKSTVKEILNNLYINFGEKWMEHSQLAHLYGTSNRNEQSAIEKQVADAYRDCMDETLCVLANL